MDSMRESVFGSLGDLTGASFLDLFSGSGVIALEAASRGASYIEAVEKDPLKRAVLLENAGISPVRIHCRFMAVELYVRRARRSFDYIFCDPPFSYRFKWELAGAVAASPLMGKGARLLLHRPREDACGVPLPNLLREDSREYGRSVVDCYLFLENGDI
jgi:16S rRNA G966 N2-methylase RsmD